MNTCIIIEKKDESAIYTPRGVYGAQALKSWLQASAGTDKATGLSRIGPWSSVADIVARLQSGGFNVVFFRAEEGSSIQSAIDQKRYFVDQVKERSNKLFPYQIRGASFLAARKSALLGDEMGLGKTVQSLVAIPDRMPAIIVCPVVAIGVWIREISQWRPDRFYRVQKPLKEGWHWPTNPNEITLVPYSQLIPAPNKKAFLRSLATWELDDKDILTMMPSSIEACKMPCVLIGDEIHSVKNEKTKRGAAFRQVCRLVQKADGMLWGLTGTPLLNRPDELLAILETLGLLEEAFGHKKQFYKAFGAKQNHWGGLVWGKPEKDVSSKVEKVMLRRTREHVLPELPTKRYRDIEIEIPLRLAQSCDSILQIVGNSAIERGISDATVQGAMFARRRELAEAKIPTLLELVSNYIDNGERPIIFSAHLAPVLAVEDKFPGFALIDGETTIEERSQIAADFQKGRYQGIVGTIGAMGVALTLTSAHHVLFVDRAWTPALNAQAEDRVCRLGQTRGVVVTNIVAKHPLDKRIHDVLMQKQLLINEAIEKGSDKTDRNRTDALDKAPIADANNLYFLNRKA